MSITFSPKPSHVSDPQSNSQRYSVSVVLKTCNLQILKLEKLELKNIFHFKKMT